MATRRWTTIALTLWLVGAVLIVGHAIGTGDGFAGPALLWELRRYGEVYPIDTISLPGLLLIVPPILLLVRDYRRRHPRPPPDTPERERRAFFIACAVCLALTLTAVGALYRELSFPGEGDAIVRVDLDALAAGAAAPENHAVLVGTAQTEYWLSYDETETGLRLIRTSHTPHNLVPMTAAGWTPNQPVRFLIDVGGSDLDAAMRAMNPPKPLRLESHPGYLLAGQVPSYVAAAFEDKGLILAAPVMLHTRDSDVGRTPWLLLAVMAGNVAIVLLVAIVATLVFRRKNIGL